MSQGSEHRRFPPRERGRRAGPWTSGSTTAPAPGQRPVPRVWPRARPSRSARRRRAPRSRSSPPRRARLSRLFPGERLVIQARCPRCAPTTPTTAPPALRVRPRHGHGRGPRARGPCWCRVDRRAGPGGAAATTWPRCTSTPWRGGARTSSTRTPSGRVTGGFRPTLQQLQERVRTAHAGPLRAGDGRDQGAGNAALGGLSIRLVRAWT
ncbi:hypothetical protein QJS66_22245 [Kocuria rhizophila]|nr:hypothetical protein QJS66_22245 [Kocuria rhizophila]